MGRVSSQDITVIWDFLSAFCSMLRNIYYKPIIRKDDHCIRSYDQTFYVYLVLVIYKHIDGRDCWI